MPSGYVGAFYDPEFSCYNKGLSIFAFQSNWVLLFRYFQHPEYNCSDCKILEEETKLVLLLLDTRFIFFIVSKIQ